MNTWLMSANATVFNHELAFSERGFIDWKQNRNYCIDDVVFIYCTKPLSCIRYVTKVIAINQSLNDIGGDIKYWQKPSLRLYASGDKFFRIQLIASSKDENLSFERIKEAELLRYPPQSPQRVDDDLLCYLMQYFQIRGEM